MKHRADVEPATCPECFGAFRYYSQRRDELTCGRCERIFKWTEVRDRRGYAGAQKAATIARTDG